MEPAVHIHRWRNEYMVPREHPAPEEVRYTLDRIADHLSGEVCAGLAPLLAGRPEPVLLLRQLAFDCELDLSRDSWLLVSRWANSFARALIRAVDTEPEGSILFPSATAFRAQFITDLAAGRACHLWYYRSFLGVELLSASSAIRTLLLEDPDLGRETLASLSSLAWDHLACVLTRVEALRILEGLSDGSMGADESHRVASLLARFGDLLPAAPWHVRALRIFAYALTQGIGSTYTLTSLARIAAKFPSLSVDGGTLAEALARGDLSTLLAADPAADHDTWALLASHPEWREVLADAVREVAHVRESASSSASDSVFTSFAGLAMLLPELDDLFSDLSLMFPDSPTSNARSIGGWLTLAKCTGADFANRFLSEPAWRDFFAIPPKVGIHDVRQWLQDKDAGPALSYLSQRAHLLARGECVAVPVNHMPALIDRATHIWASFDDVSAASALPWQERLASARRSRADWRYLQTRWELPAAWQLFFTQAAQIVLRRFAYRIPGFAGTSLAHLWTNFLGTRGYWNRDTGLLRFFPPPLHTLLQLTGISRGEIHWSGPPARFVRLEYEQ